MSYDTIYYPLTSVDSYVEIKRIRTATVHFDTEYIPFLRRVLRRVPSRVEGYYEIYKARIRVPDKYVYLLQVQYTVLKDLDIAYVSDIDVPDYVKRYLQPQILQRVVLELLRYTASLVETSKVYIIYQELGYEARRIIDTLLPELRRQFLYKLKS